MKKLFSFSVVFFLGIALMMGQAQESNDTAADAPADGPVMAFETEMIDYGLIEQNSDPLRKFKFTNTGNEPLVIKHAKGSCGCTVPSYPKEPIMPGESNVIEVRYDTKRLGKFTKRVTLTTNAVDAQKVLTIKGEVKKKPAEPEGVPTNSSNLFNSGN